MLAVPQVGAALQEPAPVGHCAMGQLELMQQGRAIKPVVKPSRREKKEIKKRSWALYDALWYPPAFRFIVVCKS